MQFLTLKELHLPQRTTLLPYLPGNII